MKLFLKVGIAITSLLLATMFCNAHSLVMFKSDNGNYGFKDLTGKIIIPATYRSADDFCNGFAKVGLRLKSVEDVKEGLIDSIGKITIPIKYDEIDASGYKGLVIVIVIVNNKKGLLLTNSFVICQLNYNRLTILDRANAAILVSSNKYGIVNFGKSVPKFEITFPIKYDEITYKGMNLFSFKQ